MFRPNQAPKAGPHQAIATRDSMHKPAQHGSERFELSLFLCICTNIQHLFLFYEHPALRSIRRPCRVVVVVFVIVMFVVVTLVLVACQCLLVVVVVVVVVSLVVLAIVRESGRLRGWSYED